MDYNSKSSRSSINVRTWTHEDEGEVFAVLKDAAYSLTWPGFIYVIGKRPFHVTTVILSAIVYTYTWSTWMFLASISTIVTLAYLWQWVAALVYLYGPPLQDMKNVRQNYFSDDDSHFWVAEISSNDSRPKVAGTIAVVKMEQSHEKVAKLRRMAVGSCYRRLGIAEQLVNEVISFCRQHNYDKLTLITTELHAPARRLYKKLGFKCSDLKPYYYFKGLICVWTFEFELTLK